MAIEQLDLTELRKMWQRRALAAEAVRRRMDPTGMTRPARSPEERAWLRETGQESVFIEIEPGHRRRPTGN